MRFPVLAIALIALSGCSDDEEPPPRVFIYAQIGPGTESGVNDSTKCGLPTEEWLNLGTKENPVESGAKLSESTVSVACSVKQSGDGFDMVVNVGQSRKGSFTARGKVTGSGAPQAIIGSFTRGDTGTFRDNNCSITFPEQDMGVGPGKIWGAISCPHASFQGGQERTCLGQAPNFRFERCDK